MQTRNCPKCGNKHDVTETQIGLGSPVKCGCGCSFEVVGNVVSTKEHFSYTLSAVQGNAGSDGHTEVDIDPNLPVYNPQLVKTRRYLPVIGVLGILGLMLLLWLNGYILSVMLLSIVVTAICAVSKKKYQESEKRSLGYLFFDKCFEFVAPFALVITGYVLVAWFIDGSRDKDTLDTLMSIQSKFDSLKLFLDQFKLTPMYAAAIIAIMIFVDWAVSWMMGRDFYDLSRYYKYYSKWSKRIVSVGIWLCSFTFLGHAVGEKQAELAIRRDQIITSYSNLVNASDKELTSAVQQKLFSKVMYSVPQPNTNDVSYPSKLRASAETIKRLLALPTTPNSSEAKLAKDLLAEYERFEGRPRLSSAPLLYTSSEDVVKIETPLANEPTAYKVKDIETASSKLEKEVARRPKLVTLMESEGGTQLLSQFPKSFSGQIKTAAFEAFLKKYPFFEPIVETFIEKFNKYAEDKIKASKEKVANALLKNPNNAEQILDVEASKIVAEIDTKWSINAGDRIKGLLANVQARVKKFIQFATEFQKAENAREVIASNSRNASIDQLLSTKKRNRIPEVHIPDLLTPPSDGMVMCKCDRPGSVPYLTTAANCSGPC